ncbi:Outer membrane protein beta-barrel domain-containing protein [Parelusimicrobium proximum]|uniref:outer membrane beta-barrel protein n=1 Tax=Parelusimicrobium proximum TaxID=3228953 RepID=UPI003D1827FB
MKKMILSLAVVTACAPAVFAQAIGPCTQETPAGTKCYMIVEMDQGAAAQPQAQAAPQQVIIEAPAQVAAPVVAPAPPVTAPAAQPVQTQAAPAVVPGVTPAPVVVGNTVTSNAAGQTTVAPAKAAQPSGFKRIVRPYISGNVGVGSMSWDTDVFNDDIKAGSVGQWGGAAGIAIIPAHLRFEFAYTKRDDYSERETFGSNNVLAQNEMYSRMFNMYVDLLAPEDRVGMFVGMGLGNSKVKTKLFVNGSSLPAFEDRDVYGTYAGYLGLMFRLNDHFFFDLTGTYYYIDMDEKGDISGYTGSAGLRYMF